MDFSSQECVQNSYTHALSFFSRRSFAFSFSSSFVSNVHLHFSLLICISLTGAFFFFFITLTSLMKQSAIGAASIFHGQRIFSYRPAQLDTRVDVAKMHQCERSEGGGGEEEEERRNVSVNLTFFSSLFSTHCSPDETTTEYDASIEVQLRVMWTLDDSNYFALSESVYPKKERQKISGKRGRVKDSCARLARHCVSRLT